MKDAFWGRVVVVTALLFAACRHGNRYIDLATNQYIPVKKDSISGYILNSKTGEPVDIYVDTKTHDTIDGVTGEIVNGKLRRSPVGAWSVTATRNEYGPSPTPLAGSPKK